MADEKKQYVLSAEGGTYTVTGHPATVIVSNNSAAAVWASTGQATEHEKVLETTVSILRDQPEPVLVALANQAGTTHIQAIGIPVEDLSKLGPNVDVTALVKAFADDELVKMRQRAAEERAAQTEADNVKLQGQNTKLQRRALNWQVGGVVIGAIGAILALAALIL